MFRNTTMLVNVQFDEKLTNKQVFVIGTTSSCIKPESEDREGLEKEKLSGNEEYCVFTPRKYFKQL